MKKLFVIGLFLISVATFAQRRGVEPKVIPAGQEIELKDNKFYINNEQIPSYEIKNYLKANDFKAYSLFNKSKNKSVLGGFFLGLGSALIIGDAVKGAVSDADYPTAMTYIGGGLVGTSIFVLNGKKQKMRDAIDMYNNGLKTISQTETTIDFVANNNGVGLRLTF